jgi:hypothetical protein
MFDTTSSPSRHLSGQVALVILALLAWPALRVHAQGVTVGTAGDALKIHAPGFAFIKAETLARLKDGRSVRLELAVMVLAGQGKSPVTGSRHVFTLSYDLWEERFAATIAETPPRSISHLTPPAAEAWCVEQLAVPLSALGNLGRDRPFWIRLEYRILDSDAAPPPDNGAGFTLQGLIDTLSRRRKAEAAPHSIEAGPFRLPQRGTGPSPSR